MTKEAREAYNAYMRNWRKDHREKTKEYKNRHWEKKAEQIRRDLEATEKGGC